MQDFVITIDTEGDNLWAKPREIKTENARYLPRFQALCERHGLKTTYLVNFEMAQCPAFQEFGRDLLRRNAGEIGMHLHAWNSPPIEPLTDDDGQCQPYLIEYPDGVMRSKIHYMTRLLEDTFQMKPVSHRAGRWAFDERYARMLLEEGYRVDCSVTPYVSWAQNPGCPAGRGGINYQDFQVAPYYLDPTNIKMPANKGLIEVPVTIHRQTTLKNFVKRGLNTLLGFAKTWPYDVDWLRPNGTNRHAMAEILAKNDATVMVFMLHSSELMPGGSPYFTTEDSIQRLFGDMEVLFTAVGERFRSRLLKEITPYDQ